MDERKTFEEELKQQIRKKRIRKYSLIALAVVVVVSTVVGLKIEDKDALLADGQGNVVVGSQQGSETDPQAGQDAQADDEDAQDEDGTQADEERDGDDADGDGSQGKSDEKTGSSNSGAGSSANSGSGSSGSTKKPTKEEAKDMTAEELKVDNSEDFTASNGGNKEYKPDVPEPVTVTISIRCDTLSSDMSKLENPAIEDYIPADGVILKTTTYQGTTDNTVFDVLNTVCRNNDIQLEFSYTPLYESYYIEGINYLYEFDGGNLSGWMYKVNGWFPNYGCSSYYLSDGDVIEWVYTCDLGYDVGGGYMAG